MKAVFAGLSILIGVLPLAAQSPAADSARRDSATRRLAPVTVTATRQSESTLAAPLAVTVIDKTDLQNKRGYSLDEALKAVPGVIAQTRYGSSDIRLVIRGFGARGAGDRSNAGTSRGVRVLLDGIPETEPDGRTSFDLVDLAAATRIEIVRSNASALYGNAAGGVVDISTAVDAENPFASFSQMAGSYGLLRSVVQAGAPVGSGSTGITFTNTSTDGWRAHSSARRSLVNASYSGRLFAETTGKVLLTYANDLFHIPGPLTRAEATADPRAANAVYASRDERRYNRVGRIGITADHPIDSANSLSAMMYLNPKVLQRSERGTYRDFNRYHFGGNLIYRNRSRYTPAITGTSLAGIDGAFQDGSIRFYSLTAEGTRGPTLRDDKGESAQNTGVFVQQELLFGDRVNVELGARFDDISYDYRNFLLPQTDAARSFRRVTPKVGTSYMISGEQSVYFNVGGGIEAPAGNETDPASTFGQDTVTAINPLLEAILSTTYEIGTKHMIVRPSGSIVSAFTYDIALYRTDVRNEIVPYRGGRFYFTAGKVKREGFEVGGSIHAPGALRLKGALTLSRNRYVDYTIDSLHYGRPGQSASYAGNRVAGLPDNFYSISVQKGLGQMPMSAEMTLRGIGKFFADDANTVRVPAHDIAGLTIALSRPLPISRNFLLAGFVEISNLFDRRYIGSAFTNPDFVGGVPVAFEPGSPRGFVVALSVSRGR